MAWVAVGTAALGAGTALYGANKQAKTQAASDASNRAAIEQADRGAWNTYLMQRGVYGANAPTGTIPGMQPGGAVNTRLPLWATVNMQSNPGPLRVVRRGSTAPTPAPTLTPAFGNPTS